MDGVLRRGKVAAVSRPERLRVRGSLIGAQIELAGAFAAPAFVVREAPEVLEHQLELGRRSSGQDRWGIGVESEVREDAHDDGALFDERHEPPPGTAVVAAQDVDAEDASQELRSRTRSAKFLYRTDETQRRGVVPRFRSA